MVFWKATLGWYLRRTLCEFATSLQCVQVCLSCLLVVFSCGRVPAIPSLVEPAAGSPEAGLHGDRSKPLALGRFKKKALYSWSHPLSSDTFVLDFKHSAFFCDVPTGTGWSWTGPFTHSPLDWEAQISVHHCFLTVNNFFKSTTVYLQDNKYETSVSCC
jgi:hypothetical protein